MSPSKDDDEKRLVAKVKQMGYRVRKPGKYRKVTLLAHDETLAVFREMMEILDYRLQEATTEAMELWIEHYRAKAAKRAKQLGEPTEG